MKKDYRPTDATLIKVVQYLESIELEIMGPAVDLVTGERYAANRNFDARQTVIYRRMLEKGELDDSEEL